MEPSIIGTWSKRPNKAITTSSDDASGGGHRAAKRSRYHDDSDSDTPSSSSSDEERSQKYATDLLMIRDVVEELQTGEREFHRAQQARYESLKRTIIDMESRWTKEGYERKMARSKMEERRLKDRLASARKEVAVRVLPFTPGVSRRKEVAMRPPPFTLGMSAGVGLPTPSRTTDRPNVGRASDGEEGMEVVVVEERDTVPRLTAQQKGKKPLRPPSPTSTPRKRPALPSPFEAASRLGRKSKSPPISINSSDGDDEDDDPMLVSLRDDISDQLAANLNDDGDIDWPPGAGIGSQSREIEMADGEPVQAASTPMVPVCPGPFKMTPLPELDGEQKLPGMQWSRSLRKRGNMDYKERLVLGLSEDEDSQLSLRNPTGGLEDEDESYRPPEGSMASAIAASTGGPDDSESSSDERAIIRMSGQAPPAQQSESSSTTQRRIQLLGPPPSSNFPNPMLRFSRSHIQKAFGGKPRGTITIVTQKHTKFYPLDQFLCINGKLNPFCPPSPGKHGAMYIFRGTGVVPLGSEWAVFCNRPRIGSQPQDTFEYVGHYVVRGVEEIPWVEWARTTAEFKKGWASHIATKAKAAKGWARVSLVSRGLVRANEEVTAEQLRAWFGAVAGAAQFARLGRRILEFKEYKRGLYDALVQVKQRAAEEKAAGEGS